MKLARLKSNEASPRSLKQRRTLSGIALAPLTAHLQRVRKYRFVFDQIWYVWNLVLRRFPHCSLPFRRRIVNVRHSSVPRRFRLRLGTTDWYVANEVFEEKEYRNVCQWAPDRFRTIVDVGANIGLSARFFSDHSSDALIKAVEPAPDNYELLKANLSSELANGKISLVRGFLGSHPGFASLDVSAGEWAFKMVQHRGGEWIQVFTMEEILGRDPFFEHVDLLKCDIEGAEAEIFATCGSWISRIRHLIVETHRPYTPELLGEDIAKNGGMFEVVEVRPNGPHALSFFRKLGAP